MKLEPPYEELKDLISKIMDWWDENGKIAGKARRTDQPPGHADLPAGASGCTPFPRW